MRTTAKRRVPGFTLIELLVVIAIIGTLIGLLLPAVQKVRESANNASCQNNLKQLGLALLHHHNVYHGFPPGRKDTPAPKNGGFSWVPFILPYIDQENLARIYNMGVGADFTTNDFGPNKTPGPNQEVLTMLICPSAPGVAGRLGTNNRAPTDYSPINQMNHNNPALKLNPPSDSTYIGVMGHSTLTHEVRRRIDEVKDGASRTLLLAEDAGRNQVWVLGEHTGSGATGAWANPGNQISIDGFDKVSKKTPGACAINCTNNNEVYSFHPGGANVLLCDGSVKFLFDSISIDTLVALMTRSTGPGELQYIPGDVFN
jgi:prepilin-type N-terminal cleavage/methylation domain-containing protein/prepilin-type processing-associated H-X9-DG protein